MAPANSTALVPATAKGVAHLPVLVAEPGQEPEPPPCIAGTRLAAVVHLDLVGYSRLSELDEAGTVARLRDAFERVLQPLASQGGGRVANTAGDSALLVFPSAGSAVRFALAFQHDVAAREAAEVPDRAMRFRIGVTVADVLETAGTDVHGDGVNIAARLQAACPSGTVCVSRGVRDQTQGKLDADFEPLGALQLKNIARPVEAYLVHRREGGTGRVRLRLAGRMRQRAAAWWLPALAVAALLGGGLEVWGTQRSVAVPAAAALPDLSVKHAPRLSLAVLPFANTSGDPGQDYLADAVTEDLTTDLSRLGGAFVIGRGSAQTYRGRFVDTRRVGGELGVRYLVQGSVRRVGDGVVRVNAELVSTETGEGLWAERFDQDIRDIGQGQDAIVRRLGYVLKTRLVDSEAARSLRERPNDPDAFDLVLRARSLLSRGADRQRSAEAEALFQKALEQDPRSLPALVGLANRLLGNIVLLNAGRPGDLRRAEQLLAAAEALSPNSLAVVELRAFVRRVQGRCDEAIAAYQQVIDADPNEFVSYAQIGVCKLMQGQPEAALPPLREAIRRNPADPYIWLRYGRVGEAFLQLHQPEDAIPWLRRSLEENPARAEASSFANRVNIISALAYAGRGDEARRQVAEAMRLGVIPYLTVRAYKLRFRRESPNAAQHLYIAEGLRIAGVRDHVDEDADAGVPSTGELHEEALGSTPTTVPGATVIRTDTLQRLLAAEDPLLLDTTATGRSLPGAVVLGDNFVGGSLDDAKQEGLRRKLQVLSGNDLSRPIVALSWNAERWSSRNLALRLVALGHTRVFWYRGGKEVWEASGLPETDAGKAEW